MSDNLLCSDEKCWSSTFQAAQNGHPVCLQRAYQECEWEEATTLAAALSPEKPLEYIFLSYEEGNKWNKDAEDRKLECLKFIYENCGDVATWQDSYLDYYFRFFSGDVQDYIDSVKDNWEAGANKSSRINIKG